MGNWGARLTEIRRRLLVEQFSAEQAGPIFQTRLPNCCCIPGTTVEGELSQRLLEPFLFEFNQYKHFFRKYLWNKFKVPYRKVDLIPKQATGISRVSLQFWTSPAWKSGGKPQHGRLLKYRKPLWCTATSLSMEIVGRRTAPFSLLQDLDRMMMKSVSLRQETN